MESQQYQAACTEAVAFDLGAHTKIELSGPEARLFLHNLCTNDVKNLPEGCGCEAFLTNVQGKILGYVFVFCRADSLVVETVPGQAESLVAHLDRYLIREDVQLHNRTAEWGELLLAGAQSPRLQRP